MIDHYQNILIVKICNTGITSHLSRLFSSSGDATQELEATTKQIILTIRTIITEQLQATIKYIICTIRSWNTEITRHSKLFRQSRCQELHGSQEQSFMNFNDTYERKTILIGQLKYVQVSLMFSMS
jgi:hypothetical protein